MRHLHNTLWEELSITHGRLGRKERVQELPTYLLFATVLEVAGIVKRRT